MMLDCMERAMEATRAEEATGDRNGLRLVREGMELRDKAMALLSTAKLAAPPTRDVLDAASDADVEELIAWLTSGEGPQPRLVGLRASF